MKQEAEKLAARFRGVNRAAFARDYSLKGGQSIIYQHINALRPISLDAALVYAKGFGCGLEEISPRLAKEATDAASQTGVATSQAFGLSVEDADLSKGRRVPIVGTVQGGDDGYLEEFDYPAGHGDGEEMYYGRDQNTYALRVRGDSMAERIMSGDRIIVEPNTLPQSGDIAVVILKDGRKTVKKMMYIRDDELHLAAFNRDHKSMNISMEQVQSMHKVVQIIPR